MIPGRTLNKRGAKQVRIRSTGAEKRRFTVAATCSSDGKMLPAFAIFKGKRKLKFNPPAKVKVAVQIKAWMDKGLMKNWFTGVVMPYAKGRRALLIMDAFSAHKTDEMFDLAKKNNVDLIIIPGGCTSKVQPLDVCLNKPFKDVFRTQWMQYMESTGLRSKERHVITVN